MPANKPSHEQRRPAYAPIVFTLAGSNLLAALYFFSANFLSPIRAFPSILGFPFFPVAATPRKKNSFPMRILAK
jgi:hypothetical protein